MIPELQVRTEEVQSLCKRFRVRSLEVFGSAATGQFHPESDFDFLVEFDEPERDDYADRYFGLLESLEKVLGRPVDLVVSSAIRNPYFRQAVDETKVLLYAA